MYMIHLKIITLVFYWSLECMFHNVPSLYGLFAMNFECCTCPWTQLSFNMGEMCLSIVLRPWSSYKLFFRFCLAWFFLWVTRIADWLEGSLLNVLSPAPALAEQGFLCTRNILCMQPGIATVPPQGGSTGCWWAFCGVKRFYTATRFPQGDIATTWKILPVPVQK